MKLDTSSDKEILIYDFNALQAYKIGRHLETEGIDFYNSLIQLGVDDAYIKEVLEFMIDEEKRHLDFFQKKIDEITALEEDGFEEEDIEDFLDPNVFPPIDKIKNVKKIIHTRHEAIKFCIMIENRTVMFYDAILKHTEDKTGKTAIKQLIKEEKKHMEELNRLID